MNRLSTIGHRIAKRIVFFGSNRYCNVCRRNWRKFRSFGVIPREDACCPGCDSLERHRLAWEFFQRKTDLFDDRPKRVLHVAAERCMEPLFRRELGRNYVTADLMDPRADHQWDVMAIPQPDESFDVIYCSHVLEHVLDDRKALAEFYRVLTTGGWAVLNVPITATQTYEDPSITDPVERERLFGQKDHVRRYGPDYVNRLREAGFRVEVICKTDLFSELEIARLGLCVELTGEIYFCTK
ncbi:MAG: methyltransferase domain-containing protein [Pirellulales bacterium]